MQGQQDEDEDEEEEFGKKPSTSKKGKKTSKKLELDPLKNFGKNELREIQNLGLMPPDKFLGQGEGYLEGQKIEAEDHLKAVEDLHKELYKKKGKSKDEKLHLENLKIQKRALKEYLKLIKYSKEIPSYTKMGQGMRNPNQLIDRLKLLGGSIMAGNNGVVPEFTQIAKYLNSIKVLPTKELNKMMKTMKIYLGII